MCLSYEDKTSKTEQVQLGMQQTMIDLPFRHPIVRDLAWVMASPGLLQVNPGELSLVSDEWCRKIYTAYKTQLHELDENPAPLLLALSHCKSHRLGVYFECLLAYWLNTILEVKELRRNLPIFQLQPAGGRKTLGEFDFLFAQDDVQQLQHWEATVKFYLRRKAVSGEMRWLGPGGKDRLDNKLNRLLNHQLKLSTFPEAASILSSDGDVAVAAKAFVKGYLFYPLNDNAQLAFDDDHASSIDITPHPLSANHLKGWWVPFGKMAIPKQNADSRWLVLPKLRWLSPVQLEEEVEGLLDEQGLRAWLQGYFCREERALLLVELCWQAEAWREISRGFVVAADDA